TTVSSAGPFRSRTTSRAQAPAAAAPASVAPIVYRTHCAGWASADGTSLRPETRPLVWILDGAGDLKGCSNALGGVNSLAGEPLELAVFPWSHGYRKLWADQTDMEHAREQGARLAAAILERKAHEPSRRVVVIGHSAGCAVELAAGDLLPRDAIDRFILLAPS